MKPYLSALIGFCLSFQTARAIGPWAAASIPESLLKNADAVLRLEETSFEIISLKETVQTYHWVLTVLNSSGDKWAGFYEYYDRLRSLADLEGYLYDAAGNLLRKTKAKDFDDISAVDAYSLIDDNRARKHAFYYKTYPYTVEYKAVIRYHHSFFFPDWMPQGNERMSVEKSSLRVVCPDDYQYRYKALNYPGEPVATSENRKKITSWEVKGLKAIVREPYQPPLYELSPVVYLGPTDFKLGEYKGNMQTWEGFGQFINALKKGRDELPAATRKQVRAMLEGLTDTGAIVKKLYDYLQKNTRYVSIQLGIGGWQPQDANFVASHAYGDCKALTNYMYSLLKEAGIPSAYTLIYAGRNRVGLDPDFPDNRFNHVILAVPLSMDTLWLECTSQTVPAGYMGSFTGDRYALMIDENGGKVVRTPHYGVDENTRERKLEANLDEEAGLTVKALTRYRGIQQDELHGYLNGAPRDYLKQYLLEQFDFPSFTLNDFSHQADNQPLPSIVETLDLSIRNYATVAGKRMFIVPNIMSRSQTRVSADSNRRTALVSTMDYRDMDTVEIILPAGYVPESLPADVSLQSDFGNYSTAIRMVGNKLVFYRRMERYSGRLPASRFAEFTRFFDQVYRSDRNKVVLIKQ